MSVEAIKFTRFTAASDVWSFAMLVWEVMTLAEAPYSAIPNVELVTALKVEGHRLLAPAGCPASVYGLLLECWHLDPNARPTFPQIETRLHTAYLAVAAPDGAADAGTNTAGSPQYMRMMLGWRCLQGCLPGGLLRGGGLAGHDNRPEQQAYDGPASASFSVPHALGAADGSAPPRGMAAPEAVTWDFAGRPAAAG